MLTLRNITREQGIQHYIPGKYKVLITLPKKLLLELWSESTPGALKFNTGVHGILIVVFTSASKMEN